MDWTYNGIPFTDDMINDYHGFVYIITDQDTGRMYVGQKNFWTPKVRSIKGKKKKVKVVSDYKDYFGSNTELQELVQVKGPDHFKREILHLVKGKGQQNYLEMREQMDRRVLENPDKYFNAFIGGKIHRKHLTSLVTDDT